MPMPDFDIVCDALTQLGVDYNAHPAELHGLACCILAAGFEPDAEQWLQQAAHYVEEPRLSANPSTPLIELFRASQVQLEEGDFQFQLCLPDDELYGLSERSESLA